MSPHLSPLRTPDDAHELALLLERRRQLREELAWLESLIEAREQPREALPVLPRG
jgi:hypothetical protein